MAHSVHERGGAEAGGGLAGARVRQAAQALAAESDRWFLWGPVLFGAGVGAYFALAREPSAMLALALVAGAAALYALARPWPLAGALAAGLLCAALGFADIKLKSDRVASPTLGQSIGAATVSGWVERVERRGPRAHRLTLRVRAVEGLAPEATPFRARVVSRFARVPATGDSVTVRAVLRPVPEPVQPGGFDFARGAWFARLGAVGFTVAAPEPDARGPPPPVTIRLKGAIDRVRKSVEARIEAALPGEPGALAIALITGERGAIPPEVTDALRHSGLAHVLAISGLHMALMAGSLYWLARAILAAFPALALRYAIKKWAACVALAGGAFYLALSGAGIATQRAFIMMAILFIAILLERPALTLRNVALAAWIILAIFPETLLDVSFQMSFAAVVGLVAVYEEVSRRMPPRHGSTLSLWAATHGWRYMAGIAITTLVASVAIAPFAAYHFHRLAQYSLLANLAAMPVVGLVVMPMALETLLAMPLGLEAAPLWLMAWGIEGLVGVARTVSGWEGAVIHVPAMPTYSLVLIALGGLWLALWRGHWRLTGVAVAAAGLIAAGGGARPDLLVDRDGGLVAVRGADGLLVTAEARRGYSIEHWLRADGDARVPAEAAAPDTFRCDSLACVARVRDKAVAFVRHPAALADECERADIVITDMAVRRPCRRARLVVDRIDVWADGAHAVYLDGQSIRVETVAERRGRRPWVSERRRRERAPTGTAVAGEENRAVRQ